MSIAQGVILVGGLGTRLGALTRTTPKPMLDVAGRPFVEHVIAQLARFGISEILLLAGFRGQMLVNAYDGRSLFGARISVVVEPEPMGTAGALKFAAHRLASRFLLANGDTFFDTDLTPLLRFDATAAVSAVLLVRHEADVQRFGTVRLAPDGRVVAFKEKPLGVVAPGWIDAGICLLQRDCVMAAIKTVPCSLTRDVLPRLAATRTVYALKAEGYFVDIGVPESLRAARRELAARRRRPAAFLDRDGVLNIDHGYTHCAADLHLVADAPAAVRALNAAGYYVFVVSNQGGIARGYYDVCAVRRFHAEMQARLIADGAHIDGFYVCPHHPEGRVAPYAQSCACRKPKPGLLREAARDWPIDRGRSFLIGDKDTDIGAAQAFGIPGYKFAGGSLRDAVTQIMQRDQRLPELLGATARA